MEAVANNTLPVFFTEGALKELKQIQLSNTSEEKSFLRIGVKGGGCSGMSYVLEFDEKTANDIEYTISENLKMIINKAHEIYLLNVEIDFQGGLNSRGFTFKNPNASETCGCGTSFSV
ncbi:MAG: iron-sulfur cluster assembly accessory protein [Chitinophagaceae bacterium]|nr:iron-sulfur cluster assembly accessory protein [Chitinophagaceae bacterium]